MSDEHAPEPADAEAEAVDDLDVDAGDAAQVTGGSRNINPCV